MRSATNSVLALIKATGKTLGRLLPIAAIAMLLAPALHAEQGDRQRSDEIVAEAEGKVAAAQNSNPLDSAMLNQAIDQLNQAVKVDPHNDSAYIDLGFCYGLMHDAVHAEDMYRTATLINPSPANFKELADVYLRTGEPQSALEAANAGLAKDPHNAKLLNARGLALNDLERFDEAAAAFQQAVDYDPSFVVARRNLEALKGGAPKKAHPIASPADD